ncbi:MAG: M14 family metallopeptidase [Candidatus Cloacimonadaceae bacterium]|jgi:hypothetical protein|nr:M14 family metallopeptidase [Candidatus Cloacimonadota bacterium]MCB5258059.1 M14 family metallopeptidase [Candidatus Cloacimonadota bacterium]MDD5625236.1 M14 family metallopeptidase [Candidatus Cloacimonadota bacterium]MDY0111788.1 M14 family metallopeptidase [Candidatus Syntrophosphaera sp.]
MFDLLKYSIVILISILFCSAAEAQRNIYPLDKGYLVEKNLYPALLKIQVLNPELVKLHILGFSGTEELPIYGLEIGYPQATKNVLMIGQHHSDEVLGVEIVFAWAEKLAKEADSDKKIEAILQHYRFWIVPTINPEGYKVFTEGLYRYKRKNNRDTNQNNILELQWDGVDLNRNYPVFWDEDSLLPPTHRYYKGTAPASEPEVQTIVSLAQKHQFEIAIFYHSSYTGAFSERIFLPYLDENNEHQKPIYEETLHFAQRLAENLKKDYLPGKYEVSDGPVSRVGNARNYFFHIHRTRAILIEVGGMDKKGKSIIYPSARIKNKIVKKHIAALKKVFYETLI